MNLVSYKPYRVEMYPEVWWVHRTIWSLHNSLTKRTCYMYLCTSVHELQPEIHVQQLVLQK